MPHDFSGGLVQFPAHGLDLRTRPTFTQSDAPEADVQIVGQHANREERGVGSKGLLSLVSPDRTCPEIYLRTLTPTLTTTAFDRSSLEWFEARSWKLASKGLPSSLTQLVHSKVSFLLSKTSLFVHYGTQI
jgi:hypothetical protein